MSYAQAVLCRKGHASEDRDYCSECGVKIEGEAVGVELQKSPSQSLSLDTVCPDCGVTCEQQRMAFCEVCGYNFATGSHGEIPLPAAEVDIAVQPQEPEQQQQQQHESSAHGSLISWTAIVGCGPSTTSAAETVPLSGTVLVGRRDEELGIFPEISLANDGRVSRRHAVLHVNASHGLSVRDLGATNGTQLNGQQLEPMVRYELHDGDEITIGRESVITIKASRP